MEKVSVSIKCVAETVYRCGDIDSESNLKQRATLGTKIHKEIQGSRGSAYKSEFFVAYEYKPDSETVVALSGRIDGVDYSGLLEAVEEIKTVDTLPASFEEIRPDYIAQVKLYAFVYMSKYATNLENIVVRLVLWQRSDGKIKSYEQIFEKWHLEAFFCETIKKYLRWDKLQRDWVKKRDDSIEKLKFPFAKMRIGQQDIIDTVLESINRGEHAIIQAPTGTGKTLGTLYPAIKSLSLSPQRQIFYLTAKTTVQEVAISSIAVLRQSNLKLRYLQLTAKEKICFCPNTLCTPNDCEYAKGFYSKINLAIEEAVATETLSYEHIKRIAKKHIVCPFEFSLEMVNFSDIVLCDYNYVFDPIVHLKQFDDDSEKTAVFLVDEAHNLPDRAREMFSATILDTDFSEIFFDNYASNEKLKGVIKEVNEAFTSLVLLFDDEYAQVYSDGKDKTILSEERPEFIEIPLTKFVKICEEIFENKVFSKKLRQELKQIYFSVRSFLKILEMYHSSYYRIYFKKTESHYEIKLFCIDPSVGISLAKDKALSIIYFSGTLNPIHYFRDMFALTPDSFDLVLGNPFPKENLKVAIAGHISTLYRDRSATANELGIFIGEVVNHRKGNYLVFFPSYKYMNDIASIVKILSPQAEIITQKGGMNFGDKEAFLAKFTKSNAKTLVGFVVMGGIFSEGIDLAGEKLTGAVVVGVGLPGLSIEKELVKKYYDDMADCGYEYAYIYPGMIKVLQAAGRVIRSDKDKGVVLLIDHRYTQGVYRDLLPREWDVVGVSDIEQLKEQIEGY